jgi:hypothetical protein
VAVEVVPSRGYAVPTMTQLPAGGPIRHRAPSAVDLLRRLEGEPDLCTERGAAA